MPLVLVSNDANATDRYDWKDVTGVHYHYPNGYRNLIQPGKNFVYYRGMRRADGSRAQAEYFGCGSVGECWRDPEVPPEAPKKNWAWYCSIQDYCEFALPVPAKTDGAFFETIPPNRWRNGVRTLSAEIFERIISAGGVALITESERLTMLTTLPSIEAVKIEEVLSDIMVPAAANIERAGGGAGTKGLAARRSKNSKVIGDRAEEIALRYIRETLRSVTAIRHVSSAGETPGWDIEYVDMKGQHNAVEVKGTSGTAFPSFELTAGERAAACQLGSCYWIYLVSDCMGTAPKLYRIGDPESFIKNGELIIEPATWRIWRP